MCTGREEESNTVGRKGGEGSGEGEGEGEGGREDQHGEVDLRPQL